MKMNRVLVNMAPPWHPGNGAHRVDQEGLDVKAASDHMFEDE